MKIKRIFLIFLKMKSHGENNLVVVGILVLGNAYLRSCKNGDERENALLPYIISVILQKKNVSVLLLPYADDITDRSTMNIGRPNGFSRSSESF